MAMNDPLAQPFAITDQAQTRLSAQAVHTANASAALARVERLHQQLAAEITALRDHLTKAAGV